MVHTDNIIAFSFWKFLLKIDYVYQDVHYYMYNRSLNK